MNPFPNRKLELAASWSDDCCGKKDFDAPIISLSSRYWPDHTAVSHIIVNFGEDCGTDATLAEQNFSGESLASVKVQVEEWAQAQMDRIVAALRKEFNV